MKIKNVLGLIVLLLSSVTHAQSFFNADQILQGQGHQFFPINPNCVPYVNGSSLAQCATLTSGQALIANTSGVPTPTLVATSAGLEAYQQALSVPAIGTFASPPVAITNTGGDSYVKICNQGDNTKCVQVYVNAIGDLQFQGNVSIPYPYALNMRGGSQVFYSPDTISAFGLTMQNGGTAYWWAQNLAWIDSPLKVSGAIDATNHKLTNISDGTAATDGASVGQLTPVIAATAINTTALNGYSMPTNTPIPGQAIVSLDATAKTTTWATVSGGGSTTLNFNCAFNAGSSSGTTDVIMALRITAVGNLATLEIRSNGVTIGSGTSNPLIRSDISANPGCIPAQYRPTGMVMMPAITFNGSSPNVPAIGQLVLLPSGNILIYYSLSSPYFTAGQRAGLGASDQDISRQSLTYSIVTPQSWNVTTSAGANGTIDPTLGEWIVGTTPSLTFHLQPASGYQVGTVTDNCLGGNPSGVLDGDDYILSNVNQNCNVSATFVVESPGTYSITSSGNNASVIPSSDNWIDGTTSQLDFSVARTAGHQLLSITDNCNSGSPGGSLFGTTYSVTTVTSDCQITITGEAYLSVGYFDFKAVGSAIATPTSAYNVPSVLVLGFPNITSPTVTSDDLTYITTATANANVDAMICYSIGGAATPYSTFASTGFSTVISNVNSQIAQINGLSVAPITCVDLDLEGVGWNPTDIQTLISGFKSAGLKVALAPQLYTSGGNVLSSSPTNLILTAGGGTGNTYGPAVAIPANVDFIFTQNYNSPGFTIDGLNESNVNFAQVAATALSNTISSSCAGSNLCIAMGTPIAMLQAVNAGAGGFTIYNPTNAPTDCPTSPVGCPVIPSYNHTSILNNYAAALTAALSANPAIKGFGGWAINNDWSPGLYNNTDSAVPGNFSNLILSPAL